MVHISTYGLQIIRAPDVIFLWPKWQLPCSNAAEGKKKKERKKETTRRQNLIMGEGGNGLDAKSLDSTSKFYHIWTGNQLKKLAAKDRWMCFERRGFFLCKCVKEQQQQQNFASVYLLQSSRYPTRFLLLSTVRTKVLLNPRGLPFKGLLGLWSVILFGSPVNT